ncbi:MAG: restriction endonuclease subunit S [Paludibacteraceae bacterium]
MRRKVPFEVPESWEWVRISDITISIQYGYTGKALSKGKYKMLRITDIQNNDVDWASVPFVEIEDNKAEDYLLYDRDILFARTGATVGKSFLIENLNEKSVFASYLIRINSCRNVNVKYIKFFLESNYYWEQISKNSVGTGQPNGNGTVLEAIYWFPITTISRTEKR